jgi:hypothetical protein
MKKTLLLTALLALLIAVPAFLYSQSAPGKGPGQGGGMMKDCPKCGMMKMMMDKTMVASGDGGVIVMIGNKLFKYDKDLELKKEVEIKIDMEAMHKDMMKNMAPCPMMKGQAPAEGKK